jgi:PBP1b-binding outer membrane lipoprotein LpoB
MKKIKSILTISLLMLLVGCSKYSELGNGYKLYSDGKYTLCIINSEI